MRRVLTVFKGIIFAIVALILHYVLPQHDIVRVVSTEIIRADFSWYNQAFYAQADSGTTQLSNRDLRLINTEKKNTFLLGFVQRDSTEVMVYRNEDTGWIWPPYFKFDSSDLQVSAEQLVGDQWAVMTHYGWRNRYLTVFPNAISIRAVDGPDATVIPWFNIAFFAFALFAYAFLRALWRQFRQRTIDPTLEDVSDTLDSVQDSISEKRGRIRRWLDTWKSKSR